MARFTEATEFINKSKEKNRKIDLRISIDWFNDGSIDTIETSDDEFIKLNLDRNLEGKIGTSIMDKGTLVLDNSNDDYSPKSIASRFNVEISQDTYEFNVIPNRPVAVEVSVNDSDYYLYYYGLISSLDLNHDNSKVSITIEDEMSILKNEKPRDKIFFDEPVKNVIRTLLQDSAIQFDENTIDDIPYLITYNFGDEPSIYDALRKIAEMSWAKFYVTDSKLYFVDIQGLDESIQETVDTISDIDFLDNGYNEKFNSKDIYTSVKINADPYKEVEEQIVWSGTQLEGSISNEYLGSDIDSNNELQLTYKDEDGNVENTNKIPIVENSVSVKFEESVYTIGEGLESVDLLNGIVEFTNSEDYPLPSDNQKMSVNHKYSILTVPPYNHNDNNKPGKKELIAKFDNPVKDLRDPREYIKFDAVTTGIEIIRSSYSESFNDLTYTGDGGDGDVVQWTDKITLEDNTDHIKISGRLNQNSYDHTIGLFGIDIGRKRDSCDSTVDLYVNDEFERTIYETDKFGWSNFESDVITSGISAGDDIQLKITFHRGASSSSASRLRDATVNVHKLYTEQETGESGRVDVDFEWIAEDRVKLFFRNYEEDRVSVYSTYEGDNYNNIYLYGTPYKQGVNPIQIVEDNDKAVQAFSTEGSELSIDNNLIYDAERANRTAKFLLDFYSNPRTKLSINIRGKPHFELLDKIHVNRDESDIDNDFIIKQISDKFNSNGEWNQTLDLRQSRTSAWQYDGTDTVIVDRVEVDRTNEERPPVVTNLSSSLVPREAGDIPYPSIEILWDSNRFTKYHEVYIKRKIDNTWELVNRVKDNKYIFDKLYGKGTYYIKIVSIGYNGLESLFEDSPSIEQIYNGTQNIEGTSITLTEVKDLAKDGTVHSSVLAQWDIPSDYVKYTTIYMKKSNESEWNKLVNRTTTDFYQTSKLVEDTYDFKFVTEDSRGTESDFDSAPIGTITIEGKTEKPEKVEWDKIIWKKDRIKLTWFPHPDDDFDEYEIRLDSNFGSNY